MTCTKNSLVDHVQYKLITRYSIWINENSSLKHSILIPQKTLNRTPKKKDFMNFSILKYYRQFINWTFKKTSIEPMFCSRMKTQNVKFYVLMKWVWMNTSWKLCEDQEEQTSFELVQIQMQFSVIELRVKWH